MTRESDTRTIYCPLCWSTENGHDIEQLALIALARLQRSARAYGLRLTSDQMKELHETICHWDSAGQCAEADWYVHESAERAAVYCEVQEYTPGTVNQPHAWDSEKYNCSAERAEALEIGMTVGASPTVLQNLRERIALDEAHLAVQAKLQGRSTAKVIPMPTAVTRR